MADTTTMATTAATAATTPSATETTMAIPNSMWSSPKIIEDGALVILFENHTSVTYCYAKKGEVFYNRHGAFHHNDMIGQPFGSKIDSRDKKLKGYMLLLAPTPELWSRVLRHRTQIVFTLDASAIQFAAALRSGHRVVESGTGSGALTTSFARTVAPHGHVFTFEFNPTRARIATEEFQRNGLSDVVTVDCRDACEKGFPEELVGTIDLVFLDLPCPWKAIGHATKMLKQGGFFASYSPCIEQVQKTCDGLREAGYEQIKTIETRLVPFSSRSVDLPVPDFGFDTAASSSTESSKPATDSAESNGNESAESASQPSAKKRRINGKSVGDNLVARKDNEIRGHTAFLTFASKFFA
ncbi:hypothetical protein Poli38472_014303 [Pythium oligandrum]|uniref:tRNA (adenine(58)-N(1))-methyltransferase n=1 Tax=Pythium oligandrum TaxID=41045 RepID=A0A8K1C761_PYTOL|nr:hypothetical protein Poli38472_014303 [Pythium oligandrum]|eukprot:TMW57700.1 hypothetical protein Poli38472_014303 [Pythium oligandrum]